MCLFQDENARIAMCENQQWLPLVVLLGLISCSIPPQLKAESMNTLAAFSKTPEIAANLWQNIEVSQVGNQVNWVEVILNLFSYQSQIVCEYTAQY